MKAKLADEYRRSLTPSQQALARHIIRALEPNCDDEGKVVCCAAGSVPLRGQSVPVTVERGRLVTGGRSYPLATSRTPVGNVICRAIQAGVQFGEKYDGDNYRSGEGSGGSESSEDSQGSGEGSGTGEQQDGSGEGSGSGSDSDGDGEQDGDDQSQDGSDGDGEAEQEQQQEDSGQSDERRAETLLNRLWELREFCERGDADDIISTRTITNAARLHFSGGFPDEAIIHAATINWSPSAREIAGILPVDPSTVERRESRDLPDVEGRRHEIFDYVLGLCRAGVGPLLVGDAGSGKSFLCSQVADALGVPFRAIPLSEDASVAWLLGRHTPQGYVESPLLTCWRDGGVFLFDEIDAADANAIIVVNDALANGTLENPLTGERIPRNPEFYPVAAGNTYGRGADSGYSARKQLDRSTLDRWRLGRVKVEYDRNLERAIFGVSQ